MSLQYTDQNSFLFVLYVCFWGAVGILAQVRLTMGPAVPLAWRDFSLLPECLVGVATIGNRQNHQTGSLKLSVRQRLYVLLIDVSSA